MTRSTRVRASRSAAIRTTMATRILVVEDDPGIAELLDDNLTIDGFEVRVAPTGHDALSESQSFVPDLVLLDVKLPDADGFQLCQLLRQGGQRPVIFVTARGLRADKVQGFGLGADDYVSKPFDIEELVARIHAVLRRTRPKHEQIVLGPTTIDFATMRATRDGREIRLTKREFDVLRYLAENAGHVVHRDRLLTEVWGVQALATTRAVDFLVARLRRKIELDPRSPRYLTASYGDGYALNIDRP
jgi:two-component system, OmpR family, response regulator